jgi:hypothetical protein
VIGLRIFIASLAVAAGGAACDYIGPGATGVISLGPDVDAAAFRTLALRAFANPSGTFDPAGKVPGGSAFDQPLGGLTFPYPYGIGGDINEFSDYASWTFVAWLSHRDRDRTERIDSGDVFCAVPFKVSDCPFGDNYCGITSHVDCTIATAAP